MNMDFENLLSLIHAWDEVQKRGAKNTKLIDAQGELQLRLQIIKLGRRMNIESDKKQKQFPFWYLASPYSDKQEHVRTYRNTVVCAIAAAFQKENFPVYSPVAHGHAIHSIGGFSGTGDEWSKHNRTMIYHSRGLIILTLHGHDKSSGVLREHTWAEEFNKPIEELDPQADISERILYMQRQYT